MSWPQWPISTTAPAWPQSAILAPTVPPATTAVTPVTAPGTPYTPEQWATMQQQNWQQWMQWHQQYQQWQQQYGEQYQKSLSALSGQPVALPAMPSQPPLPPTDTKIVPPPPETKPPLPPEEPPKPVIPPVNFNMPPPGQFQNMNAPPPTQNMTAPPPSVPQNTSQNRVTQNLNTPPPNFQKTNYQNQFKFQGQNFNKTPENKNFQNFRGGQKSLLGPNNPPSLLSLNTRPPNLDKRPADTENIEDPKKGKWDTQNRNWAQKSQKRQIDELSDAEKSFDKQFEDWEAQFNKWKEQNAEHPDKQQYKEYEAKWENWRNQLLDRREQMRKKRLGLMGVTEEAKTPETPIKPLMDVPVKPLMEIPVKPLLDLPVKVTPEKIEPPKESPKILDWDKPIEPPKEEKKEDLVTIFNMPPKEQRTNLRPRRLSSKTEDDSGSEFLKSSTTDGGIPGLDLVKDNEAKDKESKEEKKDNTGPDFEAISKGINSILGDPNLINLLSNMKNNQQESKNNEKSNESKQEFGQQDYQNWDFKGPVDFNKPPPMNFEPNLGPQGQFGQGRGPQGGNFDQRPQGGDQNRGQGSNFKPQGPNLNQQGPNLNQQGPNLKQQGPNLNQGPNLSQQGSNMNQQRPNMNQQGPNLNKQGPNMNQQGQNLNQQGPNMNQGPNFPQGGNFNQNWGQRGFDQRGNEQNWGPKGGNFDQNRQMERPPNFDQNRPLDRPNFDPNRPLDRPNFDQNRPLDRPNFDQNRPMERPPTFDQNRPLERPPNFDQNRPMERPNFDPNRSMERPNFDQNRPMERPNFDQTRPPPGQNFDRNPIHDRNRPFDRPSGSNFQGPGDNRGPNFRLDNRFERGNFPNRPTGPVGPRPLLDIPVPGFDNRKGPGFGPRGPGFGNRNEFSGNRENFGKGSWGNDNWENPSGPYQEEEEDEDIENMEDPFPDNPEEEPHQENTRLKTNFEGDRSNQWGENLNRLPIDKPNPFPNQFNRPAPKDRFSEWDEALILKPATVVDYGHKSLKENNTFIEPVQTFDYGHTSKNVDKSVKDTWVPPSRRPHHEPNYDRYDNYQKRRDRDSKEEEFERYSKFEDKKSFYQHDNRFSDRRNPPFEKFERKGGMYQDRREKEKEPEVIEILDEVSPVAMIEDLLSPPGRNTRPPRLVIIMRGPPGSGKTFLAKLIKDKEVENGGSAPRILSLDDYFMVETEEEAIEEGRKIMKKKMVYEYEESMENAYRASLEKAFKKTITDGFFPFIILDCINDKTKHFNEMWSFAKQNGFQVYICQMELDLSACTRRNVHFRSEVEIEGLIKGWETTPSHYLTLDATSLIQSGCISEVEMEEVSEEDEKEDEELEEGQGYVSKWETMEHSDDKLARLDGTNKPLRPSRTMEDYLQLEEPEEKPEGKPGQKRVRWADLEEKRRQDKMRAIGFVVGQTDWGRMMDPTQGGSALTQTKYIERVRRY